MACDIELACKVPGLHDLLKRLIVVKWHTVAGLVENGRCVPVLVDTLELRVEQIFLAVDKPNVLKEAASFIHVEDSIVVDVCIIKHRLSLIDPFLSVHAPDGLSDKIKLLLIGRGFLVPVVR